MIQNHTQANISKESRAYQNGWQNGRFNLPEGPPELPDAGLYDPELAAYHRGRREGRRIRALLQPNGTH